MMWSCEDSKIKKNSRRKKAIKNKGHRKNELNSSKIRDKRKLLSDIKMENDED